MGQERIQRVAGEIQKAIAAIIHDELKDPRIGFVTITKAELSRDLRFAKVFFSLLGSKKQLRDTQVGLAQAAGFIRRQLGQKLKLRYLPEIVFKLDEGIEHSIHISKILDKIKDEGKSNERKKGN